MISLQHHGIKGQKWGVRHGPPYPLKKESPASMDVVYKAGYKFYRVTSEVEEKKQIRVYVSANKSDSDIYALRAKSVIIWNKKHNQNKPLISVNTDDRLKNNKGYLKTLVSTKDIKIASAMTLNDATEHVFSEYDDEKLALLSKKPGLSPKVKLNLQLTAKFMREALTRPSRNNNVGTLLDELDRRNSPLVKEVYRYLQDQGYDGIMDLQDKFRFSRDPVIIFSNKDLMTTKIRDLDSINTKALYRRVDKYLGKNSAVSVSTIGFEPQIYYPQD